MFVLQLCFPSCVFFVLQFLFVFVHARLALCSVCLSSPCFFLSSLNSFVATPFVHPAFLAPSPPPPPFYDLLPPAQLKEQLSQSHDKDSDLPTPLMFAAASSSLDSRSLNPLLTELLGCMCDIDEARRQRSVNPFIQTQRRRARTSSSV